MSTYSKPSRDKYKSLEKAQGRPMREILKDLYTKHGTQNGVAQELGVSQSTVSYWLLKAGLKKKTVVQPVCDEVEQGA